MPVMLWVAVSGLLVHAAPGGAGRTMSESERKKICDTSCGMQIKYCTKHCENPSDPDPMSKSAKKKPEGPPPTAAELKECLDNCDKEATSCKERCPDQLAGKPTLEELKARADKQARERNQKAAPQPQPAKTLDRSTLPRPAAMPPPPQGGAVNPENE